MSDESIATYVSTSDELASGYGQALADLERWREAGGGGVFYQSQLTRFTVQQHRYLNGWMRLKMRQYARIVTSLLSQSQATVALSHTEHAQAAQSAIAVSDDCWIDSLGCTPRWIGWQTIAV